MESYSVQAVLSVADSGFTSGMRSAEKSLGGIESASGRATKGILEIAAGVGVFKALSIAGNALKNSLGDAVERFDTMNRFPRIMEQLGFSTEKSNESIQKLSDGIQGLPTSLDGITASTQKIAILTGDLDKATDTSLALNDAFLASGSATADAERGLVQYTQMLSKGTVDMQSWRTLQETMGPALYEIAEAFGYAGESAQNDLYAALQSGEITFSQLNDKLVQLDGGVNGFAERAKTASGGIGTSLSNLGLAVTRGMANTIQSVDDAMKRLDGSSIQGRIESVKDAVDGFFKGVASGAGIAVQALDILAPSLAAAGAGFLAFKTAMAVQSSMKGLRSSMEGAKAAIDAFRDAEKLAAAATAAREKAVRAAGVAEKLSTTAKAASEKALKSQAAAEKLAAAATKTKTLAEKAATAELKVREAEEGLAKAAVTLKAKEEAAAAAATKSKAAQEKAAAAVTKAKANVDKKAAALEKAKASAAKIGATSSELSAKAETLDTAATKAKANADKDATGAAIAKANADRGQAMASTMGAEAEAAQAAATEAGNIVQAKSSMLAIAKTAVLGVLSGKLGIVAAAQWAWNAAQTANPIGATIAATAAVVAVIAGAVKALSRLDTQGKEALETQKSAVASAKDLADALDSTSKAYEDNASDIKVAAKANQDLADKISTLSAKENKSAEDKAELRTYVDSLNAAMDGLNLRYDEETDALNMSADALRSKAEAYDAEAKSQAAQERYIEVQKERIKVDDELASLQAERNSFEREWQQLNNDGPLATSKYNESIAEMNAQEEKLNAKKKELTQSEETLKGVVSDSQAVQAAAVSQSVQSQTLTLDQLNETQQSVIGSMNDTWKSYADQATNMFSTLSDKSDLSVADMTANLLENQRVIGDWANNIETLAQRGVDEGLLEQLRQAGPESAGYVNAMVQASDEELQGLSDAFANGGETATTAFKTSLQLTDVPDGVMNLVTQTEQSLKAQVSAADFAGIGKSVGQGLGSGITESSDQASTASANMATIVEKATRDTLQTHSPSAVFQAIGTDTVQGFVLGVQGGQGGIVAVMQQVMGAAGRAATEALNNAMSGMANVSTASFARIPAAAAASMGMTAAVIASGMSASGKAVQSGMNGVQESVNGAMRSVGGTVSAGMQSMRGTVGSGMAQVAKAVDSGMNSARAAVAKGAASMSDALSGLRQSFYRSGYYASLGLAEGINAGSGAAISAADRLANTIAETMRSALQVSSPSKVTTRIGEYAGIGPAIGIARMIPEVEKASGELAEAMLPGKIADYAAHIGSAGRRQGYAVGFSETNRISVSQEYIIEGMKEAIADLKIQVQAVISAKDTGNCTAKYVDRSLGMQSIKKARYV